MASEQTWFVSVRGMEQGPFSPKQLKQLAEDGRLTPKMNVRLGSDGNWVAAARVNGLFPTQPKVKDSLIADSSVQTGNSGSPASQQVVSPVPPNPPDDGHYFDFSPLPHAQPAIAEDVVIPIYEQSITARRRQSSTAPADWVGGAGLVLLGISPLFKWINFGAGGQIGLSGDGRIVMALTVAAGLAYVGAMVNRNVAVPVLLAVQSWGTIAAFWMAGLIWRMASIFDSPGLNDNPFAAMMASQIGPGIGLYLGLLGGITVAGALGFSLILRSYNSGSPTMYYLTQGLACVLGGCLAFSVGHVSTSAGGPTKIRLPMNPFGDKSESEVEDVEAKWKKTHHVTEKQWDTLFANFKARKFPKSVSTEDWWEVAKNKTPAQLSKLFPPLKPRDWYVARWAGGFEGSRELKRDLNFGGKANNYTLQLKFRIRTEPDLPIKELHGRVAFAKGKEILYHDEIAETPDVSFTDGCLVWLTIDPYDDADPAHRTLRYAKDDELTVYFQVSKVVLADGTEKSFK